MVVARNSCRLPAPAGYTYAPPDGGFGWWVVVGACLAAAIIYVPLSSFGLFFPDILQDLQTTTSTLSWVPSICLSTSMLFTPVANVIIRNYSCRAAAIIGGFLASLGMILSYFVTNIVVLFLTFGVIYGVGLGFLYTTIVLVLSEYFRDHFGMVTGIATAFYSVGKVIFSPLVQMMLETMTYQGVFLVLGAMSLNVCVGGAMFQPSYWHYVLKPIPEELPAPAKPTSGPVAAKQNGDSSSSPNETVGKKNWATKSENYTESGRTVRTGSMTMGNDIELTGSRRKRSASCTGPRGDPELKHLLQSKLANQAASGQQVNLASSWDIFGSVQSVVIREEAAKMSTKQLEERGCYSWWKTGPFKLDMDLLTEPIFHVIMWAGLFSSVVAVYPSVYLPSLIVENGLLPMQAAVIVSFKAGGEITGRVITPYVQEHFKISLLPLYLGLYLIQVGLLVLLTFMKTFYGMMVVTLLSGFVYGGYAGLAMLVYVDGVGHSRLSSILSLTKFLQGILGIGVGPLIGLVKDIVGAYSVCFYILAGMQFICCVVWAMHPIAKRKSFGSQNAVDL